MSLYTTIQQQQPQKTDTPQKSLRIGGSEAAAVIGHHPWLTPVQLWLKKKGLLETPENEAMRWGSLLEPVVAEEYARRAGVELVEYQLELAPEEFPWAIAHVDYVGVDAKGEAFVLEVKTTRFFDEKWGQPGTDEVPVHYFLQVQHYMHLGGWKRAVIAALGATSELRVYEIPYAPDIANALMEAERRFWENHLLNDVEPPAVDPKDADLLYPHSNGKSVTATPEILKTLEELRALKARIRDLDTQRKELEATVKAFMKEAVALVDEDTGEVLATWKVQRSRKLDTRRLKEEMPDIYAKYAKESESRVFRLK